MKHGRATEEVQERAALYALGALTQYEARSFEIHLREGCPPCQTLVKHFEKIAEGLGYAAPEVEPAFYLRDILAARVEREPRSAEEVSAPRAEIRSQLEIPLSRSLSFRSASPAPRRTFLPWAVAALFALAAALCFYAWTVAEKSEKQAVAEERGKTLAASTDADRLRGLLEADRSRFREFEQVNAALSSPGMQVLFLGPQTPNAHAALAIFWDRQKSRCVVIGQLPPAPAGKDYQLWFLTPRSKISMGLIEPDASGHAFKGIDIPPVLTEIDAAAITIEPQGGSEQPTTRSFALSR